MLRAQHFPKSKRLRKHAEYVAVQLQGDRVQSEHLLLFSCTAQSAHIGVTVSRRVGNSVRRNQLKRWIREYVRTHGDDVAGVDAVIVAKPSAGSIDHKVLERELIGLFKRSKSRMADE